MHARKHLITGQGADAQADAAGMVGGEIHDNVDGLAGGVAGLHAIVTAGKVGDLGLEAIPTDPGVGAVALAALGAAVEVGCVCAS